MIVTIDGPAGSGKSTVARELARRLGFGFLNTGAMYRAVAYQCLANNVPLTDTAAVGLTAARLDIRYDGDRVLVNGSDVTAGLHTAEVSRAASQVAIVPAVREALVHLQRTAVSNQNFVTEGRDQGSIVFPDATFKFFVTASAAERARRRQADLQQQGVVTPFSTVLAEIEERDQRDSTREIAPLTATEDAMIIETDELSIDDVVTTLQHHIRTSRESTVPAGPVP